MTDIRVDAPAEVRFLFQDSQKRVSGALGVSMVVHAVIIALVIFFAIRPAVQAVAAMPEVLNTRHHLAPGAGAWRGRRRLGRAASSSESKAATASHAAYREAAGTGAAKVDGRSHADPGRHRHLSPPCGGSSRQ